MESKKQYTDLKVILTIGSYDTKSYGFDSVADPNNTKVKILIKKTNFQVHFILKMILKKAMNLFSKNLVKYLRKQNFDGVLIDYEFPNMASRGSLPHTKHGFSLLLQVILLVQFNIF